MGDDNLRALAARVGEFYVTDRALKAAQKKIETALERGDVAPGERRAYLEAVRRYFSGFEREAREHLRDVDKRLEHVNQVHFNLTAERGVAVRRIEATQDVLRELERAEE
jgi:DNA-binding transcriptional regulator GbsR (MarR family)